MKEDIVKKINLLNQTTVQSLREVEARPIIKNFTDTGIKIIGADFGFVWWISKNRAGLELMYQSPRTPYVPTIPRKRGMNYRVMTTKTPYFATQPRPHAWGKYNVNQHLKSFVIIPIFF